MSGATRTLAKVMRYELSDVVRSRWLLVYTLFFLLVTDALLRFSDDRSKALLSLLNVVLLIIPLVTLVFSTMYLYNAREFIELLLAQPVGRRRLFAGVYLGLALPLAGSFVAGLGLPFLFHGVETGAERGTLTVLLLLGLLLTLIFAALAFFIALRFESAVKGLGVAIALWLACAVLYDGLVLLVTVMFAEYPLERPLLGLMLANPIDLARVVLLLRFDASALMGYTGAVFERFFGSAAGSAVALGTLVLWVVAPLVAGARAFQRKDF
jgi:Cu-processing system permease protein